MKFVYIFIIHFFLILNIIYIIIDIMNKNIKIINIIS